METKHIRKLLQVYHASGDDDAEVITSFQNTTSSPPLTPPPQPSLTSLDSTMALTIFVLLIALFFMGFFSVYIRHFADDSMDEIRPRRRRSSTVSSPRHPSFVSRPFSSWRGLDSQAIRSLPVYGYKKEAKQKIEDCVICLSEFEEGETVKVIPNCGHVFHVDCVDTWLTSHVTCPFCRNSQLFLDKDLEMQEPEGINSRRSTVEDYDTCTCRGPCLRRCSSCSSLGQRSRLERSLSL